MWKRSLFISAAAIALAFVACTDVPVALDTDLEPQFAKGAVVHSASGGGHFFYTYFGNPDTRRVFSFTAREHADGTFSGEFNLVIMEPTPSRGSENPAITHWLEADVLCLTVVGNEAWIGGLITNSSIPSNIDKETRFRVQDNGQGKNDPPDRMTVTTGTPQPVGSGHAQAWCDNTPQARFLFEVVQGNIQVR